MGGCFGEGDLVPLATPVSRGHCDCLRGDVHNRHGTTLDSDGIAAGLGDSENDGLRRVGGGGTACVRTSGVLGQQQSIFLET